MGTARVRVCVCVCVLVAEGLGGGRDREKKSGVHPDVDDGGGSRRGECVICAREFAFFVLV
jgi:hypothetical protein